MSDWELLFQQLSRRGFFSLKKILAYTLPNKYTEGPKITDKPLIRVLSFLAPIISFIILSNIYFHPPKVFSYFPMAGRVIYTVIICYAAFYFFLLLLCSLFLKMRDRSPALLLSMTILPPLKALLAFSALSFLFSFANIEEKKARISVIDEHFAQKREAIKQERADLQEKLIQETEKLEVAIEEHKKHVHQYLDQHFETLKTKGNAVIDSVNQQFADYEARRKEASSPEAREKFAKEEAEKFQKKSREMWEEFERSLPKNRHKLKAEAELENQDPSSEEQQK